MQEFKPFKEGKVREVYDIGAMKFISGEHSSFEVR